MTSRLQAIVSIGKARIRSSSSVLMTEVTFTNAMHTTTDAAGVTRLQQNASDKESALGARRVRIVRDKSCAVAMAEERERRHGTPTSAESLD